MQVRVRLFANLVKYSRAVGLPGTPFEMTLPDNARLNDLVEQLNLPADLVKITFVNGIAQSLDFSLKDGDEIGIFPPIGGGTA
jgi:sulfur-carrier protein